MRMVTPGNLAALLLAPLAALHAADASKPPSKPAKRTYEMLCVRSLGVNLEGEEYALCLHDY